MSMPAQGIIKFFKKVGKTSLIKELILAYIDGIIMKYDAKSKRAEPTASIGTIDFDTSGRLLDFLGYREPGGKYALIPLDTRAVYGEEIAYIENMSDFYNDFMERIKSGEVSIRNLTIGGAKLNIFDEIINKIKSMQEINSEKKDELVAKMSEARNIVCALRMFAKPSLGEYSIYSELLNTRSIRNSISLILQEFTSEAIPEISEEKFLFVDAPLVPRIFQAIKEMILNISKITRNVKVNIIYVIPVFSIEYGKKIKNILFYFNSEKRQSANLLIKNEAIGRLVNEVYILKGVESSVNMDVINELQQDEEIVSILEQYDIQRRKIYAWIPYIPDYTWNDALNLINSYYLYGMHIETNEQEIAKIFIDILESLRI